MSRASLVRSTVWLLLVLDALSPSTVGACGACFHPPPTIMGTGYTVLNAHRMALSISPVETVLWDQVQYSGDPTEFVWVLPVAGAPTLELADNGFFEALASVTTITLSTPAPFCAPPGSPSGAQPSAPTARVRGPVASRGAPIGPDMGGTSIYESVVGPYDVVRIASTDPNALIDWLLAHGFQIPADARPVIATYTGRGMGFIVLRLRPGAGVDLMRPVRVRMPGLSLELPLQMVSIGAGMTIALELFVFAEVRMEVANFGNAEIDRGALSYDYATQTYNYATLAENALFAGMGRTTTNWITDAAFAAPLDTLAAFTSTGPNGDVHAAAGDLAVVTANLHAPYLTHLVSRPARTELNTELTLRSSAHADLATSVAVTRVVNQYACPDASVGDASRPDAGPRAMPPQRRACECGVGPAHTPVGLAFSALVLALVSVRRRSADRRSGSRG